MGTNAALGKGICHGCCFVIWCRCRDAMNINPYRERLAVDAKNSAMLSDLAKGH